MNLTHEHLPLLKAARDLIDSGEHLFICYALSQASDAVEGDKLSLFRPCYTHITDGIKDAPYLGDWVRTQMRDPVWWLERSATGHYAERRDEAVTQQRLMRLAWLDKIIYDIEHADA